jgi:hypothetical protein
MTNYLLTQFDLNNKWYHNVLDGFTDAETNQRLHDDTNMNHVKYLAGHLVNVQYTYPVIAGVEISHKWDDLFAGLGQTKALDNYPYPAIEEIIAEWELINESVRSKLEKITKKDLGKIIPETPFGDVKKIELWGIINLHQTYHIGQIGILRRGFGKAPMRHD